MKEQCVVSGINGSMKVQSNTVQNVQNNLLEFFQYLARQKRLYSLIQYSVIYMPTLNNISIYTVSQGACSRINNLV